MRRSWVPFVLMMGGLAACDGAATTEVARDQAPAPSFSTGSNGVVMSSTGGGHYALVSGGVTIDVRFAFSAALRPDGRALGQFHQKLPFQGFEIDIAGEVTCMATDVPNHRAWVGGVITRNRSTHPYYSGDLFQPGHDAWFRVVDYGEGQDPPDRTTFLGFEDNPLIKTSAEYCQLKRWLLNDAGTWPVTAGNIQVHRTE